MNVAASPVSIVEALLARAGEAPDATALVYVSGRLGDVRLTRADVCERALDCAQRLAAHGVRPGDVTLIAVDHGLPQITVFLGALFAGATPCLFPALAPRLDPAGFADRLANAVERLQPRVVVSDRPGFAPGTPVSIDAASLLQGRPEPMRSPREARRASLAFLQLSSGSTGRQKAIPITHGAVLDLVVARNRAFQVTADDTVIGWVPLYHDLGLVGGLLTPLVTGVPSVLMSPVDWLARPAMLLQAVHRLDATVCTMPNFAIGYCARRIRDEELEGVRLDRWRLLVSAAEPVDPAAFDRFAARFEPLGFSRRAFATAYGLAEHVLTVTASTLGEAPTIDRVGRRALQASRRVEPARDGEAAMVVVSCGRPLQHVEVQVRSPEGLVLGDREVGEIHLRSPYVFGGYYGDPAATAGVLRDGWLATGDLGYLLNGELFICGRLKDLVIVAGMNVSAEDVELVASHVPGVKAGRLAAFGVPDPRTGSEMVVVVAEREGQEAAASDETIRDAIRARVRRELEVTPGVVDVVPPGWIVKTTSGKTARWATRERWLAGPGAAIAVGTADAV